MTYVFATKNKGKLKEIKEIIKGINIISMEDAGCDIEIEETGATFSENALIKARAVCEYTGLPALSDDSGLCIDFLSGAPGVLSARFLGEHTPYSEKNAHILELLKDVKTEHRKAQFVCAVAYAAPNGESAAFEGVVEGIIAEKPEGEGGFGYDPIFYVPEYRMTTAQMALELKNEISHRGKALRKMYEYIIKSF
ncbi:MAG: XTP/dITP diphosphatase [Clostridiales bacterium]|jgi:XTP/dITP diphosphohydrolase|nr:XTP/dITP diphosphatase [Clostridiales bacterium]